MNVYIVFGTKENYLNGTNHLKVKDLIEECSKEKCLMIHFSDIEEGEVEALNPTSIIFSGANFAFEKPSGILDNVVIQKLFKDWNGPKLGICYSSQLNVMYHGGRVDEIGPMELGDHDPNPFYGANKKKESGVYPVKVHEQDELFKGLDDIIMIAQNHIREIKELPEEFTLLASSDMCKYQAYKVKGKPFFGVQFHPERPTVVENYPDGKKIMLNFFEFARKFWKK